MTLQRARQLRSRATDAERLLWWFLRSFKRGGVHFRRQTPFERYTVDFVCHRAKLIVELDGSQHAQTNRQHDAARTAFLESRGYRVIRFWNTDLFDDSRAIAGQIFAEARARISPAPPPGSPLR
jgi:very-short-patch-repair endonuclease